MITIVEGCDGAGKTTYVNELSQLAPDDTITIHSGPLRRPPLVEYLLQLEQHRDRNLIADRWHLGELVYGPLYRGSSQLTAAQLAYVEMTLQARAANRIILDTPFRTIQQRLASRGEDFLQDEHVHLVVDFYEDRLRTMPGWESGLTTTPKMIAARPNIPAPKAYVGSRTPKVVYIIGEEYRTSNINGHPVDLPVVPERNSPGEFFMNALLRTGIPMHDVGIQFTDSTPDFLDARGDYSICWIDSTGIPYPTDFTGTVDQYAKELAGWM